MSDNVTPFQTGRQTSEKMREKMVGTLEDTIQKIRDGQVIGFGMVMLEADSVAGWRNIGHVGGYSMVGACEMLKDDLIAANKGD